MPRIFLDGADAQTFLVQHKELVTACQDTRELIRVGLLPQLQQTTARVAEAERKIDIIIGDRVEMVHLGKRVDRVEGRLVVRVLVTVILVLTAAVFSSVGTYYFTKGDRTWESPTR